MRKFTSFLISLLLVTVAFAQPKDGTLKLADKPATQIQKGGLKQLKTLKMPDGTPLMPAKAKARAKAPNIITQKPAGKDQGYERTKGGAFSYGWFGLSLEDQSGFLRTVISEDGKKMYFKDIISSAATDTYVEGDISDDGKSVTVPLGQCVYFWEEDGYGLQLAWCYFAVQDRTILDYGCYDDVTEAVFNIDDNGVMTLANSGIFKQEDGTEFYIGLGLNYTHNLQFSFYLDFGTELTPSMIPENIPAPATLETSDYAFTFMSEYNGKQGRIVQAGWDGDDFWMQGFEDALPDAWIKGTRHGDKVVFESRQFLGFYLSLPIYLMGGEKYYEEWEGELYPNHNLCDEIVFNYDEATKTLSMDEGYAIIANAKLDELYYLGLYDQPEIKPFVEVAATPSAAEIYDFEPAFMEHGFDYIALTISNVDVDGNLLNENKLSYVLYLDGEPYTFTPALVPSIDEDMTEVPVTFEDGDVFDIYGSNIYLPATGFKTIQVKTVYRGGGEVRENMSEVFETGRADANDLVRTNVYRSFDGDEDATGGIGTGRAEHYDVATFVQDANLVGAKVKSMKVYLTSKTKNKKNYKGWLAKTLDLQTVNGVKVAKTDVEAAAFPLTNHVTFTFPEGYTIPEEGIFAGYSFDVTGISYDEEGEANEDETAPLLLAAESGDNGIFMHTSTAFLGWTDMSSVYPAILPVVLNFEDGSVKTVAARFINTGDYYAQKGEPKTINVAVANNGTTDITGIDYTLTVGGKDIALQQTFDEPISGAYYGQQANVAVTIPAIETSGSYAITLTIDKVNTADNLAAIATDNGKVSVLPFLPKHRALVEEYTGTWCGWCPRGMVGMAMLAETYGEDFVGVAYHNSDPMESVMTYGGLYYPNEASGFPSAYINRSIDVDPYYGSSQAPFGIKDDVDAAMAEFAPANIEVSGEYNALEGTIEAVANTQFVIDCEDARYSVEFIVIENGLCGEEAGWLQHNYYAGNYEAANDPYLAPLVEMDADIAGLKFNDVFLSSSGFGGITGSLPETVKAEGEYTSTYTFYTEEMLNGSYEPMWSNPANMEVIALLIDNTTQTVVNAAKGKVKIDGTGIVAAEAAHNSRVLYNVMGQKVGNDYKGIIVTNGKKFVRK